MDPWSKLLQGQWESYWWFTIEASHPLKSRTRALN
jgi:hypothetical protein